MSTRFFLAFETFHECFCVLSFASKKPSKTQYVWCSGASTLISLISLHSFLPRHVQETFLLCVLPSCHMCATIIQFDTNTICVNSSRQFQACSNQACACLTDSSAKSSAPCSSTACSNQTTVDFVVPKHKIQKNSVFF